MSNQRPRGTRLSIDLDLIHLLYFDQGLSQREIAGRLDWSITTTFEVFKRLGIRTRGKREQKRYKNALVLDALRADRWYAGGTSIKTLSEWSGFGRTG